MTTPLKVFVCYKKILARDDVKQKNVDATILFDLLNGATDEYKPWIDVAEIGAGVKWESEIYSQILASDVLLALIGPGTCASEWVQREIALATALGIAVVPIGCGLSVDELANELKALGRSDLQGKVSHNINYKSGDALRNELREDLRKAAAQTKIEQERILNKLLHDRNYELLKQRASPDPKAPDNQRAATFGLKRKDSTINVHVASGDMSRVYGIDVLVNSENNYMQMARYFESRTVSSMLRRLGARTEDGTYEDTIQLELDRQLGNRPRPLEAGDVVATSSGGPGSDLAEDNKARYILHVAAVEAVQSEQKVVPYKQPDQIDRCVRKTLRKVSEINERKGVISPENTPQRAEQQKLADAGQGQVNSIIFPIFGSGHGGSPITDVLPSMFSAIQGFFSYGEGVASPLSDIYISAYKQKDVDELTRFLSNELGPPISAGAATN